MSKQGRDIEGENWQGKFCQIHKTDWCEVAGLTDLGFLKVGGQNGKAKAVPTPYDAK